MVSERSFKCLWWSHILPIYLRVSSQRTLEEAIEKTRAVNTRDVGSTLTLDEVTQGQTKDRGHEKGEKNVRDLPPHFHSSEFGDANVLIISPGRIFTVVTSKSGASLNRSLKLQRHESHSTCGERDRGNVASGKKRFFFFVVF